MEPILTELTENPVLRKIKLAEVRTEDLSGDVQV
jgi:hypothetical protein